MKTIAYSKDAARTLRRMPANIAATIVSKIKLYAEDAAALANNLKPLKGAEFEGCIRLRVGDWRVIVRDDGVVVAVIRIAARGEVYE